MSSTFQNVVSAAGYDHIRFWYFGRDDYNRTPFSHPAMIYIPHRQARSAERLLDQGGIGGGGQCRTAQLNLSRCIRTHTYVLFLDFLSASNGIYVV